MAGTRRELKKNELATGLSQFKENYPVPPIYFWEAVMWMRADNDFSAAYAGKEKLRLLPYNLRNEAVLVLHRSPTPIEPQTREPVPTPSTACVPPPPPSCPWGDAASTKPAPSPVYDLARSRAISQGGALAVCHLALVYGGRRGGDCPLPDAASVYGGADAH